MAEPGKDTVISRKNIIMYAAGFFLLTAITFGIGAWTMFPDTALERRINTELAHRVPVEIRVEHIKRRLPLTLYAHSIEINPPFLPMHITDFSLSPIWSSLIQMDPAAVASGKIFGGNVVCTMAQNGATTLQARQMRIALPVPNFSTIQVEINLEHADITAELTRNPGVDNAQIHMNSIKISGLRQIGLDTDSIDLGPVTARAITDNRRLNIQLDNPQGEFGLSAQGIIAPAQLSPRSRLSLELRLAHIPAQFSQLEDLLRIAGINKNADGYLIRLGGTIGRPHLR